MVVLNVNTDAVVVFTNKLEKLNRSAFPVAVRAALNSAAFDVKMNQLQRSADLHFKKRQPNFFKANSRVEKATGWYLDEMEAKVGMIDLGGTNFAVDDLEQQEHGGKIGGKTLIPMDQKIHAGTRRTASKNRMNKIKNVRNIDAISGRANIKNVFIRSVHKSGVGKLILYKSTIFRIDGIARSKIKLSAIYSVKKGRAVKVKPTHFMKEAAISSGMQMDKFFIEAAQKQFERVLR